jgi:hypothetical protein
MFMKKDDSNYMSNWKIESFSKTMDFSLAAQKSIFTLNGAAAIAVLAFLGNCIGKSECQWGAIPLLIYVIGIVINVAGMFLTREAQSAYTDSHDNAGMFLNNVITIFCIISLVLFISASIFVAQKAFGITGFWRCLMLWIIPFVIFVILVSIYFWVLKAANKKS